MSQAIPKYPTLQFGWPQYLKVSKAFEKFVPDVVHIVTEGPLGLTAMQAAKAKIFRSLVVFIRRFKILAGSSIWPFGEADSKIPLLVP